MYVYVTENGNESRMGHGKGGLGEMFHETAALACMEYISEGKFKFTVFWRNPRFMDNFDPFRAVSRPVLLTPHHRASRKRIFAWVYIAGRGSSRREKSLGENGKPRAS